MNQNPFPSHLLEQTPPPGGLLRRFSRHYRGLLGLFGLCSILGMVAATSTQAQTVRVAGQMLIDLSSTRGLATNSRGTHAPSFLSGR